MGNFLVTGGAGFIGCNFVRTLLANYTDHRLIVYDRLTYAGRPENLLGLAMDYPERYSFVQGDVCNFAQLQHAIQLYQIDTIINFAAESHVQRSLLAPASFVQTNIYGVHILLEAARKAGNLRFHQISTDEVYGHIDGDYCSRESDRLSPRNPYAATKACAEHLVNSYHTTYGLPITISRASNNVGPYQHPEKVVPLFATNALNDLPLTVHGDGHHMRDYLSVADHCTAIDLILHKGKIGETYNIGTGRQITTVDMADIVLDKINKPSSLIQHVRDRQCNDRRYGMDITKIFSLGWQPSFTCEEAIRTAVQWYRDNRWWWESFQNLKTDGYHDSDENTL